MSHPEGREPTPAEANAANERNRPPMHEQHPLSEREQQLVDQAAAVLRDRKGRRA